MGNPWDDAPVVGKAPSVVPAPVEASGGATPWDAAPVMRGPTAEQRATIQATDNAEEAGQAVKIGKKLRLPAALVQSDLPGYTEASKKQDAVAAAKIPALAKYIEENPIVASVSSGDWDNMVKTSSAFDGLKQAAINGASFLRAIGKIDSAGQKGFETGVGPSTSTGISDKMLRDLQDVGIFRKPGQPYQGLQLLNETVGLPIMSLFNTGLRTIGGLVGAAAETGAEVIRQTALPENDDFGNVEASAQRMKNEIHNFATWGMSGQAGVGMPRVGTIETGKSLVLLREASSVDRAAIGRRRNMEDVANHFAEHEPRDISSWSDQQLKDYLIQKVSQGLSPVATAKGKAEVAAEALDKAVETAKESKTREQSPELYAAAGAAHGPEMVHVPASKILEMYERAGKVPAEGDGLFGFVPGLEKMLETAKATGGEISIPAAQYIAHVDESVHTALREDVRLHDDGVTLTEAKEIEEDFKVTNEPMETVGLSVVQFKNGESFTGVLHSDAIEAFQAAHPELGPDAAYKMMLDQGFQTSTGRYVSREEAMQVAKNAEQVPADEKATGLIAEDMVPKDTQPRDIIEQNFLAPAAETIKGKPGANVGRLAGLLGRNLYGEPKNMTTVSVKEMVQNAFDAIKGHLEKGKIKEGKISIDLDRRERTITVSDNGSGMAPEVLGKQFLEIAGTKKETEAASGGLGIAKMLFLFGNKELHVITLRDGKVSEMLTNGDSLRRALEGDESAAPDINTRITSRADRKLFPDGHGTIVKVTVPETYKDASTGEDKNISFDTWSGAHPVVNASPLFNNIEVVYNGQTLPIGKNFPAKDFTQFANVNFEWGTARIYVTKNSHGEKWGENLHVLSNGLWQFSLELKKDPRGGWGPNIEHEFYVDVSPKVSPDEPGYPFELSRQGFSASTRKDFGKIFNYIQRTYQHLDYASSAKNFGDIQYLDMGPEGELQVSGKQKLQPEEATKAVEAVALKEGDTVKVIDGKLIVGGREIPELNTENLDKNSLDVNKMMIDQGLIDANRVMLHDNIEVRVKVEPADPFEQQPFREDGVYSELSDDWVSLVDAAREKFPGRFDSFMFEIGDAFMQLRAEVAVALNYPDLLAEGIGISFDPEYRGVSIRLPFSASFINPAVPVYTDPVRAAVGTIGTMIHELAHHKVRSHDAEFPAEMQKIQIFLDTNEILMQADREGGQGFKLSELKQHMVEVYEQYHDVFLWLNKQITEGASDTVRSRGKRFKDSGEVTGRDGSAAGNLGSVGDGGLGPSYQRIEGGEGDVTTPSNPEGPGAVVGATDAAVKAEKKKLYLHPMFKDAKAVGLTPTEFAQYSRKLEKAENDILDRAIKLHRNHIKKALSAEWKRDETALTAEVAAELKEQGPFAAEKFLRDNKIELKAENADEFAVVFGYPSGADLLAQLSAIKASEKGGRSIRKQFDGAVEARVKEEMKVKHGDLATKIAEEAGEIATDGHTFDILDFELRTLANAGSLPLPVEKATMVAEAKAGFENGLLASGANYVSIRRAVERGGREAEKALLKGDFLEAFQAKQRQFVAAVHMRESNKLQRTIDSVEKKIDKFTTNQVVPSMPQEYLDQIRSVLQSVGVPQQFPPGLSQPPLAEFVLDSEGQIAVAPWLMGARPPQITEMTVEQFRDFQKSLRSLEHVGAKAKQLDSAHEKADLQNVVFDAVRELERFNFVDQPYNPSVKQRLNSAGRKVIGFHLLVEKMFDYTDMYNPHGPITKWLDRPLRDANTREIQLTEHVTKMIRDMYHLKDGTSLETIPNDLIPDRMAKSGFLQMTRQNLREVMLNMGNFSNIQKLSEGFGLNEADLRRFVDRHATKADVAYVNAIWEIFKYLKPEADAVQLRDTGVPADTIPAVSWAIKAGMLDGGYYPIVFDKYNSDIQGHLSSKGSLFDPRYISASTPHGYTIARTEYQGALDLTGTFLSSRIQSMIHDIAFREAVRNANKLISNQEFITAVAQYWGKETADLLPGWLKDIANSHTLDSDYAKGLARGIALTRQNVVSTLIAYNPSTFIKHGFTAGVMSAFRVGGKELVEATVELGVKDAAKTALDLLKRDDSFSIPDQTYIDAFRDAMDQGERGDSVRRFVLQSSAVMRNRNRQSDDSIRGAIEKLNDPTVRGAFKNFREKNIQWGRFMVAYFDQMTAVPTWWAAYKHAFAEGENHADAVFIADKEVSRAHGSNFVGDQPYVTRLGNTVGGEVLKTFVPLYKFYNHFANMNFQFVWDSAALLRGPKEAVPPGGGPPPITPPGIMDSAPGPNGERNYSQEPGANAAQLSKWIGAVLMTLLIEEMSTAALDKDKKGFLHSMLMKSMHLFGGQFVGLREITSGLSHGYGPGSGLWGTLTKAGEAQIKDIAKAGGLKAGIAKDAIIHAATTIGFITGLGGTQVGRVAQFLTDVARKRERPDKPTTLKGFNEWRQGLRTGHTKPRVH